MLLNNLRIALRNLWKNKTFAAINLVGLALGITCCLGIFFIVRYELSYDQFHKKHDRIYRVVSEFRYPEGMEYQSGVPLALTAAFKVDFPQAIKTAGIFGGYNNQIDILDGTSLPGQKRFKIETGVFYVEPDFFDMFDYKWLSGDPASVLSEPNQAAITRELAEKYFGTWQNAVGKIIQKDNAETLKIAGIMENLPRNTDLPLQIVISYKTLLNTDYGKKLYDNWGTVTSRSEFFILLNDPREAASVTATLPRFREKHVEKGNTTDFYSIQPLDDIHFNETYGNFSLYTISKKTLWSISIVGVFLLALACINFVNLATAQAIKRSREVGIRKVLGSQRWQLVIQFMSETFLLVMAAGLLSASLLSMLERLTSQIVNQPVSLNPFQSPETILLTIIILLAVTMFAGFYPSAIISGYKPIQALKNKVMAHSTSGISLRRVLVVVQFVIAQGLIFCTLIIISQLKFFQQAPIGYRSNAALNITVPKDSISRQRWDYFKQQLTQIKGVNGVSFSYSAPSTQGAHTSNFKFNQTIKDEPFSAMLNYADTAFFNIYRLNVLAGRIYNVSDTAREAVINETMFRKLGLHRPEDALGKYIVLEEFPLPIIGVIKDYHQNSFRDPIQPMVIVSKKDSYRMANVKFEPSNIQGLLKDIEKLYAQSFPDYLFEYHFLDETIAGFYKQEQKLSRLSILFAVIGIFISCIGLYGLILFITVQRIKEVGIRKVLGASVTGIVILFCKEFALLVVIAFLVAGSVAGYFMNSWLTNFAYHINLSWWMFAAVGLSALVLAIMTVSIQTIKAALVNPVKSLRSE